MKKGYLFPIAIILFTGLAHPQDRSRLSISTRSLLAKEKTLALAEAEVEAASHYDYADPLQNHQRVALYRDAIPIFEKAGRRLQQAQALELLGDCLQYRDISVADALPPLLEAFHIYTTEHATDLRNISALLACTYSRIGDHHSALLYGLMAVKLEEARPNPTLSLCVSYNRVGLVYYNMGDYLHADTALTRAVCVALHFRDTGAIKESMLNSILVKIKLPQPDSALWLAKQLARNYPFPTLFDRIQLQQRFLRIYIATKRFRPARPITRRFIHLSDSLPAMDYSRAYIEPALVEYALAIKEYPLARKYALRYRVFCLHGHCPSALYKSYYQLYLTDSAEGHFKSAIADYRQYARLRDSLQSRPDTNQVLAMQETAATPAPAGSPRFTASLSPAATATSTTNATANATSAANSTTNATANPNPNPNATANATPAPPANRRSITTPPYLQQWPPLLIPIGIALLATGAGFTWLRYRTLRRNRQLEAEKEWLVKELHHRVKNNLQIVMSLLNTQSHYLDNETAQAAIGQSRNRMYALSLIHQRLYQPDNLEQIDMNKYVPDLVQYLRDNFPDRRRIAFHLDIGPTPLDVTIAVPIGLILNEAISNSLQWAFPGDRPGAIRIVLRQQQGLTLEIADDGIGLPAGHESQRQHSMGIQLMENLVQQLEGSITITGDNGTRVSIRLPIIPNA